MPGDRYFRKKLEGRQLMRWYFPSKYNMQDFRTDEYFEMQAERFAEREPHHCVRLLQEMLEKVSGHREQLRSFFGEVDEATFLNNPSLQDLYGLFRLVDPDPALSFTPPTRAFREHSPLVGLQPPFRVVVGAEAGASAEGPVDRELCALWQLLKEKLSQGDSMAFEARLSRLQDTEEVREVLLEEAKRLGVVLSMENTTVFFEERSAAASTAAAAEVAGDATGAPAAAEVVGAATGEAAEDRGLTEEQEEKAAEERRMAEEAAKAEAEAAAAKKPLVEDPRLLGDWVYDGAKHPLTISRPAEGDGGSLSLSQVLRRTRSIAGELRPVEGGGQEEGEGWLEGEARTVETKDLYARVRLRLAEDSGSLQLSFLPAGTEKWQDRVATKVSGPPGEAVTETEGAAAADAQKAGVEDVEGEEFAPLEENEGGPGDASSSGPPMEVPPLSPQRLAAAAAARRRGLVAYMVRPELGGSEGQRRKAMEQAEKEYQDLRRTGPEVEEELRKLRKSAPKAEEERRRVRAYIAKRHRFIDPMFRRRRLKWLERQMSSKNKEREVKFNEYFSTHPDDHKEWPTNKGSVTVVWPSPYH